MKQEDLKKFHKKVQRQTQPHRHVVQLAVNAPMKPPESKVPIEPQVPDEPLDPVKEPLTPKESVVPEPIDYKEPVVPEPQQLPMLPPKPVKPMVPE